MNNTNKTEYEVHWAGEVIYMCETHLQKLQVISTVMMGALIYTPYSGNEKCKNCENEAVVINEYILSEED